jgi:hypothetical protein
MSDEDLEKRVGDALRDGRAAPREGLEARLVAGAHACVTKRRHRVALVLAMATSAVAAVVLIVGLGLRPSVDKVVPAPRQGSSSATPLPAAADGVISDEMIAADLNEFQPEAAPRARWSYALEPLADVVKEIP